MASTGTPGFMRIKAAAQRGHCNWLVMVMHSRAASVLQRCEHWLQSRCCSMQGKAAQVLFDPDVRPAHHPDRQCVLLPMPLHLSAYSGGQLHAHDEALQKQSPPRRCRQADAVNWRCRMLRRIARGFLPGAGGLRWCGGRCACGRGGAACCLSELCIL